MKRFFCLRPICFVAVTLGMGVTATGAQATELDTLISCHDKLVDRSEGTSQKMALEKPTPFVFQKGNRLYFVTDKSIATLDNSKNALSGKTFVVQLTDHGKTFAQDVEVRRGGALGSVCCETHSSSLPVADTRATLGPESIAALKDELLARLKTVEGSYQNKDAQMNIIGALHSCEEIDFGAPNPVHKLLKKYAAKKSGGGSLYEKRGGTR